MSKKNTYKKSNTSRKSNRIEEIFDDKNMKKIDTKSVKKEAFAYSVPKQKEKRLKKCVSFIIKLIELSFTVLIVFMALIIITQRISNNQDAFLGYRIFRVETGSMIPKYLVGDVILVKEKKISEINIGDDLVYVSTTGQMKGRTITHSLIRKEINEDGTEVFYTKGIANNSEDPAVYSEQIQGTVVRKIITLSCFFHSLNNNLVIYIAIVVPLTIYVFFKALHRELRK